MAMMTITAENEITTRIPAKTAETTTTTGTVHTNSNEHLIYEQCAHSRISVEVQKRTARIEYRTLHIETKQNTYKNRFRRRHFITLCTVRTIEWQMTFDTDWQGNKCNEQSKKGNK